MRRPFGRLPCGYSFHEIALDFSAEGSAGMFGSECRVGRLLPAKDLVVFLMGSNPNPFHSSRHLSSQGAVVAPDANGKAGVVRGKLFEMK